MEKYVLAIRRNKESFACAIGKIITDIHLDEDENAIFITLGDESIIGIFDDGQDCCETRYMCTDDDLSSLIGAVLLDLEIKEVTSNGVVDDYVEDVMFLELKTSKGSAIFSNHNEHNGYYGGFSLAARVIHAND